MVAIPDFNDNFERKEIVLLIRREISRASVVQNEYCNRYLL
jgi:hypothetical protein